MNIKFPNKETTTRILREADVHRLTGVSRVSRWRWERSGRFPQRIRLGERAVGWREDEILAWLAALPRGAR
jgi:prophage regulatory protein